MSIRVMVDLVTEIERTGAPVEEVVNLAKKIDADENLHFAGLLVYPGNPVMRPYVQEAIYQLNQAGLGVDIVSGSETGAAVSCS